VKDEVLTMTTQQDDRGEDNDSDSRVNYHNKEIRSVASAVKKEKLELKSGVKSEVTKK
jgi:hypothetical protein